MCCDLIETPAPPFVDEADDPPPPAPRRGEVGVGVPGGEEGGVSREIGEDDDGDPL